MAGNRCQRAFTQSHSMALINLQIREEKVTKYEKNLLRIVSTSPGAEASELQIYEKLLAEAKVTKWFGRDSFLAALFGPNIGRICLALWGLEEKRVLEK